MFRPSPEQSAIIDHPARAVRISAGAGTGKTTTIVHRLSTAVDGGADPARSLGITFTNKAADELRQRLRDAVPPRPDGREIEVATYHGFAAAILDEFGARHGWPVTTAVMDEGHRFELAARILRASADTDLDLTKIPSLRKEVLAMADAVNEHLLDPSDIRAVAPVPPDDVWRIRLSLLDAAERYVAEKEELGLVEYSDLIRRATHIVEADRTVATTIRNRYDQVLLDEYQDTDRAQRRLLTAIFTGGPTVTAVGDADQTIYEWRGASLRNFEAFPTDFPLPDGSPAPTLPLSINRRSDRTIIDLANLVRGHLPTIEGAEDLVPAPTATEGTVIASWHRTEGDEASWIAARVAERHEEEGIAYADMAVLCRRRDSVRTIAETFRTSGIPYTVTAMSDLLDVPEIADLHAWLTVLAHPDDEHALLRILLGGRYRLGLADVARIRRTVPRGSSIGLMDAVLALEAVPDLDARAREATASFRATYRDLHARSQALSLAGTVAAVVEAMDLWSEIAALPEASAITARLNLGRFIDLAARWRPLRGFGDVAAYLRYLDALAEPGRAEELDAAEPPTDDAVVISTAHGAKGLEWSDVYLADVARGVFPSNVRDYHEPLTKPSALPYEIRLDAEDMADVAAVGDADGRKELLRIRHQHQEWRLAYVAVTRAKHRLSVSGHAWHGDNTTRRVPGPLLELVVDSLGCEIGPFVDDDVERPDPVPFEPSGVAPDPVFPEGWASAVRATIDDPTWPRRLRPDLAAAIDDERAQLALRLDGLAAPTPSTEATAPFVTSVTNLVALAECPLKFRWIHHDRLPRRPRASARRGTEFHRRAELHNLGVLSLDDATEVEYDEADRDAPAVRGVDPWEVFAASRFAATSPRFVETPFVITLDGRSVRGKVDAIYADGDRWEIVDYKSGAARPSDERLVQLEAYATAAADGALGAAPPPQIDVTFAWFGEDPVVEMTRATDAAWLDTARARISNLLEVADEGPFPATPSEACRWCDFLHHCRDGQAHLGRGT